MPASFAARMMRTAISPRFAMSSLVMRRGAGWDMDPYCIASGPDAFGDPPQTFVAKWVPGLQERSLVCSVPERGPGGAGAADEPAQGAQRQADDGRRIAVDVLDEGA